MTAMRYRFGRAQFRNAVTSLLREAPSVLRLFGRLMTDARVSGVDRGLVGAVIVYVLSPWDLIPDFLSIVGVIDDLFLLGIALDRLLARAPAEVVQEHWDGTPQGLDKLTAELTAIGDALPNTIRSLLHGRVADDAWGSESEEVAEVYEGDWPAARRSAGARSRPRRPAERDLEYDADPDEEAAAEERTSRYRTRL